MPGVFLARQLGQRFGFITDTKRADAKTYDLFKQYKLDVEMAALDSVRLGIEEVALSPEKNFERVVGVARKMVNDGADVIINGCTFIGGGQIVPHTDQLFRRLGHSYLHRLNLRGA